MENDPTPNPEIKNTATVHHRVAFGHTDFGSGIGESEGQEEGSRKGRKPKKVPELNIVAMLDVCFNLLIFFMSTASFAVGEGILPATLPRGQGGKAADTADAPTQPITILLKSRGGNDVAIEILGTTATSNNFSELYASLWQNQARPGNDAGIYNPDDPVIIMPDPSVNWGSVVSAFNSAVRARYSNINFAQPQKK